MQLLWNDDEDIRSLKSLILFGLRGMAAYALRPDAGLADDEVNAFFPKGMKAIGDELGTDELLSS